MIIFRIFKKYINDINDFYLPFQKSYIHNIHNIHNIHKKKLSDLWLDHIEIMIPTLKREYNIPGTFYRVDGYDNLTKTIYEFQGDFWHGNPNVYNQNKINPVKKCKYGELYDKTVKRRKILESLGYKYIEIWETEFLNIYKFKS